MVLPSLVVSIVAGAMLLCAVGESVGAPTSVRVRDAFARMGDGGRSWTIGTSQVAMRLEETSHGLVLAGLSNRVSRPEREYVGAGQAHPPFAVSPLRTGTWSVEYLRQAETAGGRPVADLGLQSLAVRAGDLVGFTAGTRSDDAGGSVSWSPTIQYQGAERYSPADDPQLAQGPVWSYYTWAAGTGAMDPLTETVPGPEPARVPGGYRAPFECSRITASGFSLVNALDLVRVWRAPRDGVVVITGRVQHIGGARVLVGVARILPVGQPETVTGDHWHVVGAHVQCVSVGGRPAVQLDLVVEDAGLKAVLHVQAYPGSSILRLWVDLANIATRPIDLGGASPFSVSIGKPGSSALTQYWMCGGTSRPNQGALETGSVSDDYHHGLLGDRSDNYVPWTALQFGQGRQDGLFVALDHLGTWALTVDGTGGAARVAVSLPEMCGYSLRPGSEVRLPMVTIGVFDRDLDDMGRRIYDWQYEYLWDFANSDYFARTKWAVPWFFCSRNLQEQFTARLANLDMDADLMRGMGMEMLWDDAGWSKYPGWPVPDNYSVVFNPSNEGPDYAETLRYLGTMGMRWILWFAGRPSAGVMDTKVGSWGDFQWRTDGFGRFGVQSDRAIRSQFERYLLANPGSSFHTCDGGSRYAHQFEIQRYADVNYLSDLGRDAKTNHFLSYLDLPDKWCDIIDPLTEGGKYNPDIAWGQLSMVPGWYAQTPPEHRESVRQLMDIYRYLRREGVVGRWSHMYHPRVVGEPEHFYDQRTSYNALGAVIIVKHRVESAVVVFPKGLVATHRYTVGGHPEIGAGDRTGSDLMANGIALGAGTHGGIIALGLPLLPGSGADEVAPSSPGRAITRCETFLGHIGVGVYWSPATDNNWISYYEVRRNGDVIGRASVGTFLFDHGPGWSDRASYAVRAVDGDGNRSDWVVAERLEGGSPSYAALGGHFSEPGREGWSAYARRQDGRMRPMVFVPPARNPAGDLGGTPNQPGGVEGYWEGAGGARIGRGWQQAGHAEDCIRTWTAPSAGMVRIVGRAMKECYRQSIGGPLRVRIEIGEKPLWPASGWAEVSPNDWQGATHDLAVAVAAGDVIRFVLAEGSSSDTDIVAWMPRITYTQPDLRSGGSVVRIACGSGRPITDKLGNVWSKDRFYVGGRAAVSRVNVSVPGPTPCDPTTLRTRREGADFVYAVRVEPGLYSVRVRFAEPTQRWSFERPMAVAINGREVLEQFDVCHAARGPRRMCERTFRNIVPDAAGLVRLRFSACAAPRAVRAEALVSSIEVLPEVGEPVRVNAGSMSPFVDWNSYRWEADRGHEGGETISASGWTAQASPTLYDQALYQTARAGRGLTYRIAARPGHHTVHLKFAELWLRDPGGRPIDIAVNGHPVRSGWDPATAAGQVGAAADIRVPGVTPDAKGQITITLKAKGENDAILQAIEIE